VSVVTSEPSNKSLILYIQHHKMHLDPQYLALQIKWHGIYLRHFEIQIPLLEIILKQHRILIIMPAAVGVPDKLVQQNLYRKRQKST